MRIHVSLVVVLVTLLCTPSYGWDLCSLFGFRCGDSACGSSCEPGCGCDSCGCDVGCGAEIGCGCESSCGCSSGCANGRQFGGQTWDCCEPSRVPICECTGPVGCGDASCGCATECGCGVGCEPGCGCGAYYGCGAGCGTEIGCGCEPACGYPAGGCGGRPCWLGGIFFGSCCGKFVQSFDRLCGGCSGCSSEVYWNEWHNDPPSCCDPCDRCGNWTGPGYGGLRAPYDQGYHVGSAMGGSHFVGGSATGGAALVAKAKAPTTPTIANRTPSTRKPSARSLATSRPTFTSNNENAPRRVAGKTPFAAQGQLTRKPAAAAETTFRR